MRDTTGRPDDGTTGELVVREITRYDYPIYGSDEVIKLPPPQKPGTLTVGDVLNIARVDELRLERAADEAIAAYCAEGHSYDEIKEHERRIWALHDQILKETV